MTDTDTQKLVERLQGPVQWGYMCLADGGFIADDTPVEAADFIAALDRPATVEGEVVGYLKEWTSEGWRRSRIDRVATHEPWLDTYSPTVTPLARLSAAPSPGKDD